MIPAQPGIYAIVNLTNGRHYVGSAINIRKRKAVHLCELRKGKHDNSKLQRAFNKYGEAEFRFDVLELVADTTLLIEREQFWMDSTRPFYNILRVAGSSLGRKATDETKAKIAAKARGRKCNFTAEHRANISRATKGKRHGPLSEAHRAQISEVQKARWTDEERQRYGERAATLFLGKEHTEETKQALRDVKAVYDYLITAPDGTEHRTNSMTKFCADHPELHACAMMRVAHGKQKAHKGWTVIATHKPGTVA
jgi:group I intron endonuclease